MRPVVNVNRMGTYSDRFKRNICECLKPCEKFVTIASPERDGESFIMCERDAKRYVSELKNALGLTNLGRWTTGQEATVIKHINKHGVKYGSYAEIGKKVGKTREQVRDKVKCLRAAGRL